MIRRATPPPESGIGSPNTIGPEAIVTTFAAALVMAITATAGPSCSERADTTSPIRLSSEDDERERVQEHQAAEVVEPAG